MLTHVSVPRPLASSPLRIPPDGRRRVAVWVGTFLGVTLPVVGVVAAGGLLWGRGFGWVDLGGLVGMYLLSAVGITVGFHRLFTHRAFQAARPVQVALGVLGSMAFQGPLLEWVARHRLHHQHSDQPGDPHSPRGRRPGVWAAVAGFFHAHIGWAFAPDVAGLDRYSDDLRKSRLLRVVSVLFPLWAALGLAVPAAIGWVAGGWGGALSGMVWGGLVRIFLVHHVTWSVNSVCHLWGRRPYRSDDDSRNNAVFGVLALGEGWHNNHHAFPTSARHGLRWFEPDVSYWVIRGLAAVGLAWDVKVPSARALAGKRR